MSNLNQTKNNPLLSVIEHWWPTQKENLSGLRSIDAQKMLCLVLFCLDELHDSDDCNKTAEYLPTKIVSKIEDVCEGAPADDRKRCAACVCMLVSVCMTMINATTVGNRKLMWAQNNLQHKMEQFEDVDSLFEGLWKCIEEQGAEKVSECARMIYNVKSRNVTEENNTQEQFSTTQTYSLTAERWVELYGDKISHNFKDATALKNHINKLRERFELKLKEVEKNKKKHWKARFLRNEVCHPNVVWISNLNDLTYEMIQGIFGENVFSKDQLSDAKMQK